MPSGYMSTDEHSKARRISGIDAAIPAAEARKMLVKDPKFRAFLQTQKSVDPIQKPIDVEEVVPQKEYVPAPAAPGGLLALARTKAADPPAPDPEDAPARPVLEEAKDAAVGFLESYAALAQTGLENALDGKTPLEAWNSIRDRIEKGGFFDAIDKGAPINEALAPLLVLQGLTLQAVGLLIAIDQNGADW